MPDSQRQRPGATLITTKDNKKKKQKSDSTDRADRARSGGGIGCDDDDSGNGNTLKRQKQFARIADLENQLTNLGASNDDVACKCRAQLCEILSDILVASPTLALETDCFGRLWKNCFYNPINAWRVRVTREKRKQLPSVKQTMGGFKNFLSESLRLYDYFVHQYLSKLVPPSSSFSSSSQDRLTSTSQQSSVDSYTQDSTQLTAVSKQESLDGVVPGLYRLYIYLGDLYRYDEAYNKAEKYYTNAAKLAPGRGNPYNQLAVVAFTKDAHCVALYWYARSLLATHEKFTTSSNNLIRLFGTNREYLREHSRDSKPTVLVKPQQHSGSAKKSSSNENSSMVRAQKAAASKSCLAHFVDFHYDLYLHNDTTTKVSPNDETVLREKMLAIVMSLDSLLQVSGFSDGLLTKIVVIITFSLERAKSESKNDTCYRLCKEFLFLLGSALSERVQTLLSKTVEKASPTKPAPAVRLLLPFEILLEFVEVGMESSDQQHLDDTYTTAHDDFWKNVASVGSLVRKVVDAYKVEHHSSAVMTQDSRPPYVLKEYELLRGYRPFAVLDQPEYTSVEDGFLDPDSAIDVLELSPSSATPQETTGTGSSTGGNSIEENKAKLLRMLDTCKRLSLPSSRAPIAAVTDKQDGGMVSVFQFVSVYHSNGNKNGELMDVVSDGDKEAKLDNDDDCMIPVQFDNSIEDDAGDIVLYQVDVVRGNDGPTLLVPDSVGAAGKVAQENNNSNSECTAVGILMEGTDSETTVVNGPNSSFPPGMKPPPGFAATTTLVVDPAMNGRQISLPSLIPQQMDQSLAANMESFAVLAPSSPYATSILGQVIQGRAAAAHSMTTMFHDTSLYNPGFLPTSNNPGFLPTSNNPVDDTTIYGGGADAGVSDHYHYLFGSSINKARTAYTGVTVGESIELFGDPTLFQTTANPFASQPFRFNAPSSTTVVPNTTLAGVGSSSSSSFMYEQYTGGGTTTTEGTQFLGAAFLNSLVMDEVKTDNPWATK